MDLHSSSQPATGTQNTGHGMLLQLAPLMIGCARRSSTQIPHFKCTWDRSSLASWGDRHMVPTHVDVPSLVQSMPYTSPLLPVHVQQSNPHLPSLTTAINQAHIRKQLKTSHCYIQRSRHVHMIQGVFQPYVPRWPLKNHLKQDPDTTSENHKGFSRTSKNIDTSLVVMVAHRP